VFPMCVLREVKSRAAAKGKATTQNKAAVLPKHQRSNANARGGTTR
jgi:hypothetical protein